MSKTGLKIPEPDTNLTSSSAMTKRPHDLDR